MCSDSVAKHLLNFQRQRFSSMHSTAHAFRTQRAVDLDTCNMHAIDYHLHEKPSNVVIERRQLKSVVK